MNRVAADLHGGAGAACGNELPLDFIASDEAVRHRAIADHGCGRWRLRDSMGAGVRRIANVCARPHPDARCRPRHQFELHRLPPEPFANSLGALSGRPQLIEIEFDSEIADYVALREWHRSQEITVNEDGSILMRLCVCNDQPLRTWILGFGAHARVVTPTALARAVFEDMQGARERYMPVLPFKPLKMALESVGERSPSRSDIGILAAEAVRRLARRDVPSYRRPLYRGFHRA